MTLHVVESKAEVFFDRLVNKVGRMVAAMQYSDMAELPTSLVEDVFFNTAANLFNEKLYGFLTDTDKNVTIDDVFNIDTKQLVHLYTFPLSEIMGVELTEVQQNTLNGLSEYLNQKQNMPKVSLGDDLVFASEDFYVSTITSVILRSFDKEIELDIAAAMNSIEENYSESEEKLDKILEGENKVMADVRELLSSQYEELFDLSDQYCTQYYTAVIKKRVFDKDLSGDIKQYLMGKHSRTVDCKIPSRLNRIMSEVTEDDIANVFIEVKGRLLVDIDSDILDMVASKLGHQLNEYNIFTGCVVSKDCALDKLRDIVKSIPSNIYYGEVA